MPYLIDGDHVAIHHKNHTIVRESFDQHISEYILTHLIERGFQQSLVRFLQCSHEPIVQSNTLRSIPSLDLLSFLLCLITNDQDMSTHLPEFRSRLRDSSMV